MKDTMRKLQLLAHSEMALAEIRAQRAGRRSAYFAIALVFALLAVGTLNLAIYQALVTWKGPVVAALTLTFLNTLAAVIMVRMARSAHLGANEEKLARELRETALAELSADMEQVKVELLQVTSDVRKIRSALSSFTHSVASTLEPMVKLLLNTIKRH